MDHHLSTIRDVTALGVWFGVPILVFLPRIKGGVEAVFWRVIISTGVTWVCLVAWFLFVGEPAARTLGEVHHEAEIRLARQTIIFYGFIPAALGSIAIAGA